jgi:hypothetical protein
VTGARPIRGVQAPGRRPTWRFGWLVFRRMGVPILLVACALEAMAWGAGIGGWSAWTLVAR